MEYNSQFQSDFNNVDTQVRKACAELSIQRVKPTSEFLFIIDYALRELLNNAVEHGNQMSRDKTVRFRIILSRDELAVDVWDEGTGFDLYRFLEETKDTGTLRTRKRGLKSVRELGFWLTADHGHVRAVYPLKEDKELLEGEVTKMKFELDNRILWCTVNSNLVSVNIRSLLQDMKKYIDESDAYDVYKINLKEVTSIDSMGITFLIGIYKTLLNRSKKMILCDVPDSMLNLFKIMKLDEVFEFENT